MAPSWLLRCGSGDRVGTLLPRSMDAVVAMLGVLKAGAGYVPMDPSHPEARTEFVIGDAAPMAVVTTAGLRSRVHGHDVVVIDIDDPALDAQPGADALLSTPGADDVAYVIYTSGTTGVPKGVAVPHRNVVQLLETLDADLELAGQVWTQCHSLAFDFSVWEIWGALLRGGRVVVVPDAVVRSPEEFHALLVSEQVGVLSQTPSAFYALQAADVLATGTGSAAEVADGGLRRGSTGAGGLRTWLHHHSGSPRLINMYGITETTVHASFREIVEADVAGAVSPIGVPLAHLGFFVARWIAACGAGRCRRRVVRRRWRIGSRIRRPCRIDLLAICGVSVRWRGRADVSHRGPGALGCRWAAAICGPYR